MQKSKRMTGAVMPPGEESAGGGDGAAHSGRRRRSSATPGPAAPSSSGRGKQHESNEACGKDKGHELLLALQNRTGAQQHPANKNEAPAKDM